MREEFDPPTKEVLAKRVGYCCSNPSCERPTSGPQTEPTKVLNIGVAAHITAASPAGPRYDPIISPQDRKSLKNGIWLCQFCAKLVDNDEQKYTVALLDEWKRFAEQRAASEIEDLSSRHVSPEGKQILIRIEELAENGFAGVNQRLHQIEKVLEGLGGSKTLQGTDPSLTTPAAQAESDIGYLILGLDDDELLPWFYLFGDPPPPHNEDSRFKEVYFDDFNEMKDIFASIQKVAADAKEAERSGVGSQDAVLRALWNEGTSRAGSLLVQRMTNKQSHASDATIETIPGYRYMIWGVPNHVSRMIQILRTREFLTGATEAKRDAPEVYFENVYTAMEIPSVIERVLRESNGSKDEVIRLLFEEVMRLRTIGN